MSEINDTERRALLLVDFQIDFTTADGRMPVATSQVLPVLAATRAAIDQAQRRGDLIVEIGNEFRRSSVVMNLLRRHAAIAGSPGARWDERFAAPGAIYLPKWKGDAFVNPELDALLGRHGVSVVAPAGLKASACITATAKGALSRGYRVELVRDAIACGSDRSRARALTRLQRVGASLVDSSGQLV